MYNKKYEFKCKYLYIVEGVSPEGFNIFEVRHI